MNKLTAVGGELRDWVGGMEELSEKKQRERNPWTHDIDNSVVIARGKGMGEVEESMGG